jgi:hypothetical protein
LLPLLRLLVVLGRRHHSRHRCRHLLLVLPLCQQQ